ncbi:TetR/AcrR family transcriptional regulator [Vagococcus sp. JNUCC 83]
MPRPTFFRLENEKQIKIIEACEKEFSSVPIHQASIANIVKYADIPRGSFYQYFEDKDDVFYYICDNLVKQPESKFMELFNENNGHLFLTMKEFFDYFIHLVLKSTHSKLLKNIFMYMDYKRSSEIFDGLDAEKKIEKQFRGRKSQRYHQYEELIKNIDYSYLKISNVKELNILLRLLFYTMHASINEIYRTEQMGKKVSIEKIKREFNMKLNWIAYGVMKDN